MAMRPDVRRHSLIIIAFAFIQWGFVLYILNNQIFHMTTPNRILLFCLSCFGGGFLIFGGLMYMVIKGNADKK